MKRILEFESLRKKYSKYVNKIDNLEFIFWMIMYRIAKVQEENEQLLKSIEDYVAKKDPHSILEESSENLASKEGFKRGEGSYTIIQTAESKTPRILLYEFNSLIISLISYIDNAIDCYISVNYSPRPDGKHWDLGNFLNKKCKVKGQSFDFSKDLLQINIKRDYEEWLNKIEAIRHDIIHKIAKRQKIVVEIEITIWAKQVGIPTKKEYKIKRFEGFEDDLLKFSHATTDKIINLVQLIIKSTL